jgi:hypothetical protein
MAMANINTINNTKNAVEIRTELTNSGTKIEYICIDGVKCGILGSVNEADRNAALKVLNDTYVASNGNITEMMAKLATIATIEEKEINPDEMVEVCGVDIMLSYSNSKAYTMEGEEIANCDDLPTMPAEAVKAILIARAENALH